LEVYGCVGAELLGSLLKKADAVALTTDAATTITLDSIQALTAHWIGDDWELCSAVLGVSELDAEHTAVNVSLLIQALLQAYELNSNLVCVTNDGAKAQLKASAMLVNAETVSDTLRCFDHTLQLAVTHALEIDEATAILRKCRDAIAVIRGNRTIHDFFLQRQREHQAELHDFGDAEPAAPAANEDSKTPLCLFREVCTRWSSTYTMVERYLKLRTYVEDALLHFSHGDKVLSAAELRDLQDLWKMLAPFADAIRIMEGEKYVTISSYIPYILGLGSFLTSDGSLPGWPNWNLCSALVMSVRDALLEEMLSEGTFAQCFIVAFFMNDVHDCRKIRRCSASCSPGLRSRPAVQVSSLSFR